MLRSLRCCFTVGPSEGQIPPQSSVLFQTCLLLTHLHTAPHVAVGCSEVEEALDVEGKELSMASTPPRGVSTIRNAYPKSTHLRNAPQR